MTAAFGQVEELQSRERRSITDHARVQLPVLKRCGGCDRESTPEESPIRNGKQQQVGVVLLPVARCHSDSYSGEPEELLQGGHLVQQRAPQEASPDRRVDHGDVETKADQVEEVTSLQPVRLLFGGAKRVHATYVDRPRMAVGEDAHGLRGLPCVVSEIAAEVVSRSARQDGEHDISAATRDEPVRDIAQGSVTPDRHDDVVPVIERSLRQLALLPGPGRRPEGHVVESVPKQPLIDPEALATPPSSRGRVEDDEVSTGGQKDTIGSNVCVPFLYHSSRNG